MDSFLIPPSHFLSPLPPRPWLHRGCLTLLIRITVTPYNQPRFHPASISEKLSVFVSQAQFIPLRPRINFSSIVPWNEIAPSVRARVRFCAWSTEVCSRRVCVCSRARDDAWRKLIFKGLFAWRDWGGGVRGWKGWEEEVRGLKGIGFGRMNIGIFGYTSDSIRGWLSYCFEFGRSGESALRRLV